MMNDGQARRGPLRVTNDGPQFDTQSMSENSLSPAKSSPLDTQRLSPDSTVRSKP